MNTSSDEKIYMQSINDLRTPNAPDLRLYRLIPYTGKLKKLTGDIILPFTTISITSATTASRTKKRKTEATERKSSVILIFLSTSESFSINMKKQ